MLAIQPVSVKGYSKPAFTQRYDRDDSLESDRSFFEDQKAEINGLLDDERLPGGMKKGLKVVSVITDGIIAGISVACATIAGSKWSKGAFTRIAKSQFSKNAAETIKPLKEFVSKESDTIEGLVAKGLKKFKETKFGKKVVELYNDFKATKFGAKVVKAAKKVAEKTKAFFKGMNIFKDEASYDKATKKTATVLGAGSGVASAYATAVKESELKEGEAE